MLGTSLHPAPVQLCVTPRSSLRSLASLCMGNVAAGLHIYVGSLLKLSNGIAKLDSHKPRLMLPLSSARRPILTPPLSSATPPSDRSGKRNGSDQLGNFCDLRIRERLLWHQSLVDPRARTLDSTRIAGLQCVFVGFFRFGACEAL